MNEDEEEPSWLKEAKNELKSEDDEISYLKNRILILEKKIDEQNNWLKKAVRLLNFCKLHITDEHIQYRFNKLLK